MVNPIYADSGILFQFHPYGNRSRIVPLFGTRSLERFEKNIGAPSVRLRRDGMRSDGRATLPVQVNRYGDEDMRRRFDRQSVLHEATSVRLNELCFAETATPAIEHR